MFGSVEFGSIEFGGAPSALSTPFDPFRAEYLLEVDWDDDGDFDDAHEDLSSNLIEAEYLVGRDYASQLVGRSIAGRLNAQLFNPEGIYSSLKASGPLFGLLLPRRKVRLRSVQLNAAIWTGFMDGAPRAVAQQGTLPRATLSAVGPLALLANPNLRISLPPYVNATTGALVNAVLDAAGWPASARQIATGDVVIGHYVLENKGVLEALQELEEAEGGFIREGTNWDIIFESRYHRFTNSDSLVSQAELSDENGALLPYRTAGQEDPLREVFNRVEVPVTPYIVGELSVLWQLSEAIPLAPGESRTVFAKSTAAYVQAWTTPVVGVDILQTGVANGNIAISTDEFARSMKITVTNNHATLSCVVTMQARGIPVTEGDTFIVVREDAASQADFELRTYPFSSPLFPNIAYADSSAQWAIARYKDPHAVMTIGFPIKPDILWMETAARHLSDRITLKADGPHTELGVDQDFYIEGLGLRLPRKGIPFFTMMLSPALPNPDFWILNVDQLGIGTKLGY